MNHSTTRPAVCHYADSQPASGALNCEPALAQSRLDPFAPGFERVNFRSLSGQFLDDLWRAEGLSPSQESLARFLCKVTLARGRQRVIFDSLDEAGQFLKLPRSRVHPVVFGEWKDNIPSGVWIRGLAQDYAPEGHIKKMPNFRIFGFEPLRDGVRRFWLVTVWPDASLWNVAWKWPAQALGLCVGALEAKVNQITPYAPALAPAADLTDGLAVVSADSALSQYAGALKSTPTEARAVGNSYRSGKGNEASSEFVGNSHDVPEEGTPLRLKLSPKPKLKLRSEAEHKAALYELETTADNDRVRELLCVILGESAGQNDAGKWINRLRSHRGMVQRVMASVIERFHQKPLECIKEPGGLAEYYWKKFKESLLTH